MHKSLLFLALLCVLAGAAHAQFIQQRFLPAEGERGRLGEAQPLPLVQIGNRTYRLAPGGRIFDQQNRTIVHAHLPAGAPVLYTRDASGDIQRIYILTEQEQAKLAQSRKR